MRWKIKQIMKLRSILWDLCILENRISSTFFFHWKKQSLFFCVNWWHFCYIWEENTLGLLFENRFLSFFNFLTKTSLANSQNFYVNPMRMSIKSSNVSPNPISPPLFPIWNVPFIERVLPIWEYMLTDLAILNMVQVSKRDHKP